MTNSISVSKGVRVLAEVSIAATALVAVAFPTFAFAATYAYVNTAGNVSAVVANDANTALMTAPNISAHSGVMLLSNPSDPVVGDGVNGV